MKFIEIKTTFDNLESAEKFANDLLKARLIACAQISESNSFFLWKGKIDSQHEFILTMKTKRKLYKKIEEYIKSNHSYEIPEIIALPILKGSNEYLKWIDENSQVY